MRRFLYAILISFVTLGVANAEVVSNEFTKNVTDAHVYGHVIDKNTKAHIPFATVVLKGTTIGVATDNTGHFFLKNLPEGNFTIEVSMIGYTSQTQKVVVNHKKTVEVNFELAEDNVAMDQIVVSASRTAHTRRESPSLVNVLTTEIFEKSGAVCLADGLSYQPGVRVEDNCQNCGFTQVRINGLDGHYSQILMDSRPIFSALTGVYGLEQIPVNMIDRVEVVRGGGSALFGSSAIGGTINIITKDPTKNSGEFSHQIMAIGKDGALDNNTTANASVVSDNGKMGLMVYGQSRVREGYDHTGDGFTEAPEITAKTIGLRSFFRTSDFTKLTLQYHAINEYRRGGDSLNMPLHQANIAESTEHNINGGGLSFDIFSPNYRDHINVFASAQYTNRDSYYGGFISQDDMDDPDTDLIYGQTGYGNTTDMVFVTGTQYSRKWDNLWFMPAEFVGGLEYNYNALCDAPVGDPSLITDQTTHTMSLYAQNEWRTEKFGFLIGGRLDKHNLLDNVVFSPRLNIRYNPNKSVNLRATASTGFRAPQVFNEDLHIAIVGGERVRTILADNLKQERSYTGSLSADLYKTFGSVQTNLLVEGFYTKLNDIFAERETGKVDMTGAEIMERYNASGAKVYGLTVEAKAMYSTKVQSQVGVTLQRSRYDEAQKWSEDERVGSEDKMFRTPDLYGYFSLSYSPVMALTLSSTATYTGEMLVQHFVGSGTAIDRAVTTPSFFDMDFKITYDINIFRYNKLQLFAGVKNVFNQYQNDFDMGADRDAGYVYGPSLPRSVFGGLKVNF